MWHNIVVMVIIDGIEGKTLHFLPKLNHYMETIMSTAVQNSRHAAGIIILLGSLLMFLASFAGAQETAATAGDPVMVQGIVKRVSLKRNLIAVKSTDGERIKMQVDAQTAFEKIPNLEALKKDGRVQVWYTSDGDKHRAVKVVKLVDGSCS